MVADAAVDDGKASIAVAVTPDLVARFGRRRSRARAAVAAMGGQGGRRQARVRPGRRAGRVARQGRHRRGARAPRHGGGSRLSLAPSATPRLLETRRLADARGWFAETWRADRLARAGSAVAFVQDNEVCSRRAHTLRGLHAQRPPAAQAKLVRCLAGAIWDVAVDLRAGSPSHGRWVAAELSARNARQLYVPVGFAHGYLTLRPDTIVAYKVSHVHAPELEIGLPWDDPDLAIAWPLAGAQPVLSPRDRRWPPLAALESPFPFAGDALAASGRLEQ